MQWKIPKHMALQVRPDPHTCVSARVQSTMFIFRKVVGLKKKKSLDNNFLLWPLTFMFQKQVLCKLKDVSNIAGS